MLGSLNDKLKKF